MAYPNRYSITFTTDGSGNATFSSPAIRGYLDAIRFGVGDTDGTLTVSAVVEAETIWSEANITTETYRRISVPVCGTDGVNDEAAKTRLLIAGQPIQFTISNAGATKIAGIVILIDGTFDGA